jgi:bacterioferritin-associated ferredoxin
MRHGMKRDAVTKTRHIKRDFETIHLAAKSVSSMTRSINSNSGCGLCASRARKIAPAQVPQMARVLPNSLSGSINW